MRLELLLQHFLLAAPMFAIVLIGYLGARFSAHARRLSAPLARFVFAVALPAMLFHLMSDLSRLPPVDARVLAAFFGGCLLVFVLGRLIARFVFGLDGVSQSVFALGGVFSNNVLLGVPIARLTLGEAALPSVALVLVFNALTLWTLVTLSVEWSRHGTLSLAGFGKTLRGVLTNPIVLAILLGSAFGLSGLRLPEVIEWPLAAVSHAAGPLALLSLGMGLVDYSLRQDWRTSAAITSVKLLLQPLVVWLLAALLGLPPMETQVVVLLASLAVGVNVYLMARQFKVVEGAVAGSLLLSTVLAAFTTPVFLALTTH